MDFNVITQPVGVLESVYDGSGEQPVDIDITMPDYYPDIQRILKCTVTPYITGVQSSGGKVTSDGFSVVRIIYVGDDDRIRCFEQNITFSKAVEVSNLTDGACVSVRARLDYANCRAVSQRRVAVHAMVTLSFKVTKKRDDSIITGAEGAQIQLRCKNVKVISMEGEADKMFAMSEVVELGQGRPPVTQIIRSTANVVADDIKTVTNKLLIKGELITETLYCADTDSGELVRFEHSMPLSQIVEVDGVTEDCICDIKMNVMSLEVLPKADSSGALTLLDISAKISACVCACKPTELSVLSDAYSTCCELKADYRLADLTELADSFRDTFAVKSGIDIGATGISKLFDVWGGEIASNLSCKNGELIISGTVTANILYLNRDGKPEYAEKPVSFEYKRRVQTDTDRIRCEPDITVSGCAGALSGDSRLDIKLELSIGAAVFASGTVRIIGGIELSEEKGVEQRGAALTIYYSDSGEEIWGIARRYNTTVDAIKQENGLAEDVISEKCMLMIPKT